MKLKNLIPAFILLMVLLGACSDGQNTTESPVGPTETAQIHLDLPTAPPVLESPVGKIWRLVSFIDPKGNLTGLMPNTHLTIEFRDNQITGNAGCNSYFADYELDSERLTFGNAGMTENFCSEPVGIMEQEIAYLTALQSVISYSIANGRLQLFDSKGRTVLTFTAE